MDTVSHPSGLSPGDPGAAWFWEQASAAGEASGDSGQLLVRERSARAGQMPPLHARDAAESYRVLDGEITFFVEGETVTARPGDVVVAPAGAARTFRVESAGARWLLVTRVAAPERYGEFLRAVAVPRPPGGPAWPSADERCSLSSLARANGIDVLGPPGALPAPGAP